MKKVTVLLIGLLLCPCFAYAEPFILYPVNWFSLKADYWNFPNNVISQPAQVPFGIFWPITDQRLEHRTYLVFDLRDFDCDVHEAWLVWAETTANYPDMLVDVFSRKTAEPKRGLFKRPPWKHVLHQRLFSEGGHTAPIRAILLTRQLKA